MIAPSRRTRSAAQGFTLIELLVVIAIIAILTAILLPVFASVREGSRQGVAISNMKDIQQKMAQFKLDNHRYPEVLFGYAVPGTTMKTGLATAQKAGTAAAYFPGLYPAYIKDADEFTDPNNPVDPNSSPQITPTALAVNLIAPCSANTDETLTGATASNCTGAGPGSVVGTTRNFYLRDAFDSGPTVAGTNQVNTDFLTRYQLAREGTACTRDTSGALTNPVSPAGCDSSLHISSLPADAQPTSDYLHQLRWQNPPAETVVALTSYHVKNADKVLVLFESGAVKKMTGADFAAKEGAGSFWKITP
jgi:prepilin-type N-terminal cleavage/methylation domain-containing protein